MLICGLKLTQSGAVALIKDGRLVFSIEAEKLENNPRFMGITDTTFIADILSAYGYDPASIDIYAVDGWGGFNEEALAIQPRLEIGEDHNELAVKDGDRAYTLNVSRYRERALNRDVLAGREFAGLIIGGKRFGYLSYLHAAGHILSAYGTSPFAQKSEDAYILVWDGGMYPRMYFFDAAAGKIDNLGPIFLLVGNIYTIFSQHFGPFKIKGNFAKDDLSVAGKVMAYVALGKVKRELFALFDAVYYEYYDRPMGFANIFANEFKKRIEGRGYADEDILRSFHAYLEELLIKKIAKKIERYPRECRNLCLAGGCALNIKWNSAIRDSGLFARVYVAPFPNDSGSAIGAACGAMFQREKRSSLDWDVYSGPEIIKNKPAKGWTSRNCSVKELAGIIHTAAEPVVFLHGKAELGPRALGNRSILAAPSSEKTKEVLNRIKKREFYRPISPVCLEKKAQEIFEPGTKDSFMLFDHKIKRQWLDKIPAVAHIDNTARLQTVSQKENPVVVELLREYEKLSGLPLLCNTSANYKGRGFFPDIRSATEWNQVNYVWCDNVLYEKTDKIIFSL